MTVDKDRREWVENLKGMVDEWAGYLGGVRNVTLLADERKTLHAAIDALGSLPLRSLRVPGEERMSDEMRSLIEGMSVSVDVSTCEEDAGNRYFGTVTEVMDDVGDKHGVTLLVQDAKPNFELTPPAPRAAPSP